MRLAVAAVLAAGLAAAGAAFAQTPPSDPLGPPPATAPAAPSRAVGLPWRGRLVGGVQLPESDAGFLTWDPILKQVPNRPERRWGTTALLHFLRRVLGEYAAAHPEAAPVLVADLSRPRGGVFDRRFGGLGHASHQNGLDADVMYPRRDGRLRSAWRPGQVDRALAQELVDRFVAAGAQVVYVGPRLGLTGPRRRVVPLVHHDDHLHLRIHRPRAPSDDDHTSPRPYRAP